MIVQKIINKNKLKVLTSNLLETVNILLLRKDLNKAKIMHENEFSRLFSSLKKRHCIGRLYNNCKIKRTIRTNL